MPLPRRSFLGLAVAGTLGTGYESGLFSNGEREKIGSARILRDIIADQWNKLLPVFINTRDDDDAYFAASTFAIARQEDILKFRHTMQDWGVKLIEAVRKGTDSVTFNHMQKLADETMSLVNQHNKLRITWPQSWSETSYSSDHPFAAMVTGIVNANKAAAGTTGLIDGVIMNGLRWGTDNDPQFSAKIARSISDLGQRQMKVGLPFQRHPSSLLAKSTLRQL